jgi:hypothetical protein
MKKILTTTLMLCAAIATRAEGNIAVSANVGYGSYITQSAPLPSNMVYSQQNNMPAAVSSAWFSRSPIIDLEVRYAITEKVSVKITGGFSYGYNPAYTEQTGTEDASIAEGGIPTYQAVPTSSNLQFSLALGCDYAVYSIGDLQLRAGGELGYAYGRITQNGLDDEQYAGAAIGEAFSLRVAAVCGAEYKFSENFFVGLDVRPLAYNYAVYGIRPAAGLRLLQSDQHSIGVFVQPMIKIGFKF